MESGKPLASVATALSAASLACAAWYSDWIGAGVAGFALVFSAIAVLKCGPRAAMFCLAASAVSLVGTAVISFWFTEGLVNDGTISRTVWNFGCAFIHAAPLPPLSIAAFYCIAAMFNASFNWALTFSLCPFVGLGMLVPGFVMEYIDEMLGAPELPNNAYAVTCLAVGLVIMAITGVIVRRVMKPNMYLIRASGREVRDP